MNLLRRFTAKQEIAQPPYGAEVLCSNWVDRPLEQPVAPGGAAVLESLREADAMTFLARIYACQHC